jgi:hypothetical protein
MSREIARVRLSDLRSLTKIGCFEEEECRDGPPIAGHITLRPSMRTFRSQNPGIEFVTSLVLSLCPCGSFLDATLLVSIHERPRTLPKDDDERSETLDGNH